MIVTSWNPETDDLEKTFLTATVQKGTTVLPNQNTNRFAVNDFILIGDMGEEQAELAKISAVNPNNEITIDPGLKFSHTSDTPVYRMRYDKVHFLSSTSADGSYSLLEEVDIDVDNKDLQTTYQDVLGTGSSFYKTRYYNSQTSEESVLSDYISAEGYNKVSIGKVIEAVVRRVKDVGYSVLTSEVYLDIANEVNDDIESQSERPYGFMRKPVLLNRVAGQGTIDLPEDYFKFYDLEYTNTVGQIPRTERLKPMSAENFSGQHDIAQSDYVRAITIDEVAKTLLLKPIPRTNGMGAYKLRYYAQLAEFEDLSQEVQTPNTLIYRYKFLAEWYGAKAETDPSYGALSTKYEQKYGNELMKLQRSNRKDVGTDRSFMDSARVTSGPSYGGKAYHL